MTLVGDREREQAASTLRRHYVAGRLDDTELSERLDLALNARSRWELVYALRWLPRFDELAGRVRHALVVAVAAAVWLMFTAAMFVAFIVWIVAHGATLASLIAFPAVWLALSAVVYRRAQGGGRQRHGL